MIITLETVRNAINSPVRKIEAKVELYNGSTLVETFYNNGKLISFDIERAGDEGKFFGFGVSQKINVKIIDKDRELSGDRAITTAHHFKVAYEFPQSSNMILDISPNPNFYITEVHRDENTNELSITAYDALKDIDKIDASNIDLTDLDNSVEGYMKACSKALGLWKYDDAGAVVDYGASIATYGNYNTLMFDDELNKVNLEGTETLREVLNALAEVSHSIYFIDSNNRLQFKDCVSYELSANIDKSQYITLKSGDNRKLANIIHTTELGENLSVSTGEIGSTQYLRDNPFIDLNSDNTILILEDILYFFGGFTINQFDLEWRGNPLVEPGDRLILTTKDDKTVESYLINDTLSYNGALAQKTSWNYQDNEEETESTPTTIGEVIKKTYAKVDKVNKEISLVVNSTTEAINTVNDNIDNLREEVSLKLDEDAVKIEITKAIEDVNSITTTTGFKFNEEGLTVSKSENDITTTITENGMKVAQGDDEKLVANADGVKAEDLHATTYLIIGKNSRFEDFVNADGVARTACFWIGGNN